MVVKYFGAIRQREDGYWEITNAEPHVCIRLKTIFPGISKTQVAPFIFTNLPDVCHDLLWFMNRYPLQISKTDRIALESSSQSYIDKTNELESILAPDYQPIMVELNQGKEPRHYQLQGAEVLVKVKRLLLGDDMGLGKTLSAILSMLATNHLPAVVVVQAHLPKQWKAAVEEFTNLRVHIIKTTKVYDLPVADVYIFTYSKLSGWVDTFNTFGFQGAVFDEIQELRIPSSNKYWAAKELSNNVTWCLGMSGSPIYNYGGEIFWVMNVIKPHCFGEYDAFMREWTTGGQRPRVKEPQALGSFMRENHLMLRRTREEVGRELPPVNKIIQYVNYSEEVADRAEALARQLAIKATSGSFVERGQAARELDALVRHTTGVAKAHGVADFVRILLENDLPVLLAGWHRDVYDIWAEELKEYNPAFYTGEESGTQKARSKEAFITCDTNLLIMSLRSGIGVDGLQSRCTTVVFGELDWSPKVHDQFTARVDRDGQQGQVTAFYLVSDSGSDPIMLDTLGIKASQSHGIIDPFLKTTTQFNDESVLQKLAEQYLAKRHTKDYKQLSIL